MMMMMMMMMMSQCFCYNLFHYLIFQCDHVPNHFANIAEGDLYEI